MNGCFNKITLIKGLQKLVDVILFVLGLVILSNLCLLLREVDHGYVAFRGLRIRSIPSHSPYVRGNFHPRALLTLDGLKTNNTKYEHKFTTVAVNAC